MLTHAHADHAAGLRHGAPCPVYGSAETLALIAGYPLREVHCLRPRTPAAIGGIWFEAFPVVHSVRAPAYGLRISVGSTSIFYVPDVLSIPERSDALRGIALYIGDGTSLQRAIVRRRSGTPIGHASIKTQLAWCEGEKVGRAIFTHCGTAVVRSNARDMNDALTRLGRQDYGVVAHFAHDGLSIAVRNKPRRWAAKALQRAW